MTPENSKKTDTVLLESGNPGIKKQVMEKEPYPVAVYFILAAAFLSHFIYSFPYLYAFPTALLGSIICDSWIGKYKTILYFSVLCVIGEALTVRGLTQLNCMKTISIIGQIFVAVCLNVAKPCILAFGGDQFSNKQAEEKRGFFSSFYWIINLGDIISIIGLPALITRVHYLGIEPCHPLVCGIPGMLMLLAIAIFVAGKPLYVMKPISRNIFMKVCKCIKNAYAQKRKSRHLKKEHLLDYVEKLYDKPFIEDIKQLCKVLYVLGLVPMLWLTVYHPSSRWMFQASKMDGDFMGMQVSPEQMQVVRPLLVLILLPAFDYILFPILKKFHLLVSPLQRMTAGCFFCMLAIFMAAFVEMKIEKAWPNQPTIHKIEIFLLHHPPCGFSSNLSFTSENSDPSNNQSVCLLKMNLTQSTQGTGCCEVANWKTSHVLVKADWELLMAMYPDKGTVQFGREENGTKLEGEESSIQFVENKTATQKTRNNFSVSHSISKSIGIDLGSTESPTTSLPMHPHINVSQSGSVSMYYGKTYTVSISENKSEHVKFEISQLKTLSLLWQLPQNVFMAMGETMIVVSGLHFFYTEAPTSLKTVVMSAFLVMIGIGKGSLNLLDFFSNTSTGYFLYAGVMFIVSLVLMLFRFILYEFTHVVSYHKSLLQRFKDLQ